MSYRKIFYHHQVKPIQFIPLKQVPKKIQYVLVAAEDSNFYKHQGIDFESTWRAYKTNARLGFAYKGGSTITQQLTRTLFLNTKKNYVRKYFEFLIALEMDLLLSKNRILELYLNNVEFGKGVFGIGRASWYYYGKPFAYLSEDEIIRLITILPSPLRYGPYTFFDNGHFQYRYEFLWRISHPEEIE